MFRRIAAVALSVGLLLGVGLTSATGAVAAPATKTVAAKTHTCVDNYEWRAFSIGWSKRSIEYLFDTRGYAQRYYDNNYTLIKWYDYCGYVYSYAKVWYSWNGYKYISYKATRFY